MPLEDLGDDWDSRVDWVRNYKYESFGRGGGNSGGEIADDSGIDLWAGQLGDRVTKSGRRIRQFTCFLSIREQSGSKTDKP